MLEQMTLIEAGAALGISPDAVRMRIKRGSMQAEKDAEGRWLVWVDVEQAAAEREAEREADAIGERDLEREPEQGEPGAEALRAQIEALKERIGELKEERDFLRRQVDTLIFAQGMAAQKALPNPARRSWWARLWGK
jgi:DNA repair exonuclease SbcCD ATPase subunit